MRLLSILCALLLSTVLAALDVASLPADQLKAINDAAKGLAENTSSSLIITTSTGERIVVAISRIPGATAVVIGDQVFAYEATSTGFSLKSSTAGATPLAFTAAGAKETVVNEPVGQPNEQQQAAQRRAIAGANSMLTAATTNLQGQGLSVDAKGVVTTTTSSTTQQISNGFILSQAVP